MGKQAHKQTNNKRLVLKKGQIAILEALYECRFCSCRLLADRLGITSGSSLHEKLNVLMKHGFVDRRYDKSFRLRGMPAAYYVTPKGLRQLQLIHGRERVTDAIVKAGYRDRVVSQAFVNHTVRVCAYINQLQHRYPLLEVLLRREMMLYSYVPANPPDAFLLLRVNDGIRQFFFDVVSKDMLPSTINRRIVGYMSFFDSGGWNEANSDMPKLLLLLEDTAMKRRLERIARAIRSRFDLDDEIEIYIAMAEDLLNGDTAIWLSIDETSEPDGSGGSGGSGELLSLEGIGGE
ncbi:replication-relaxation family protein [TM7 phylum sp. oral taxon 349]|nr:replication-relaxation family protein [TM7 phylum sp. oral taxon 349]